MRDPETPDFTAFELGSDHDEIEIDTSDAVRDAYVALIAAARRELVIMSRHLDPVLLDDARVVEAMREFVLRSRRTRARMLVKDPAPVVRDGHQLVELAQRLSSYIEIRVPAREYSEYNAAFLVADGIGSVYREMADRYEATVAFGDRHAADKLVRQFDAMWESAESDPSLRRTYL